MKLLCISILFLLGIVFLSTYKTSDLKEGFSMSEECPNLLVQKGTKLHLIYSNKAKIPGVNPVVFNNLEDYVEFIKWQRAKGIRCPILYFQQTYDAQNNVGYRMLPDPIEKQAGLSSHAPMVAKEQPLYDANHDDLPYNKQDYAGFDPQDQYIGANTPLDKNFRSNEKISANAMDTNWGGGGYSEILVDEGAFKEDARRSYDNPYVSRRKNIAFQDELPRENPLTHHIKGSRVTPEMADEISKRYGGHGIENRPEERALAPLVKKK